MPKKRSRTRSNNIKKSKSKYSHVKPGQTITFSNGACAKRLSNGRFQFVKKTSCKVKKHSQSKKSKKNKRKQKGGNPVMRDVDGNGQLEPVYQRLSNDRNSPLYHQIAHPNQSGTYGYIQMYDAYGNENGYSHMLWDSRIGWYDGNAQVPIDYLDDMSDDEEEHRGRYSPDSVLDVDFISSYN